MTIIVDTRERVPLDFSQCDFVTTVEITKLSVGDYGCIFADDYEPQVYFERKSIEDLFLTMGKQYNRFKKEIERAKDEDKKLLLIIEGTLSKVVRGSSHSSIEGITVLRKLFTLWLKYGLYPVFCKDRNEMVMYIYEYYCSIGRVKGKKRNASAQT